MDASAFRSKNFRRYLAGTFFATNAVWMLRVIVGWIAWELSQSASFVGFIAFLYFAPTMIAGPFFGVIVDRVDVLRASRFTHSAFMGLALALGLLNQTGFLNSVTLSIYAASVGLVMAMHGPVRMSLAPRLVSTRRIASVISITATQFNITRMTGPIIGGWLVTFYGTGPAIFTTALFYLPIIVALQFLRARRHSVSGENNNAYWPELKEGVQIVLRDRMIGLALFLTATSSFFIRGVLEILPLIADGIFSKGAGGLGLLTSAAGGGAVLGGLTLTLLPLKSKFGGLSSARTAILIGLAGTASLGLTWSWWLAISLVAVMSLCVTIAAIICQTVIQTGIEDRYRARIMGIWASMGIGSAAIGAAVSGGLVDLFGPSVALPGAAIAAASVIAFAQLARISLR